MLEFVRYRTVMTARTWVSDTATTLEAPDLRRLTPDAPGKPVVSAHPTWTWAIDVHWDAVADATKYKVEWRTESQTYGPSRMAEVVASMTSYEIEGVSADTTYMVRVTAANGDVYGTMSDDVTVRMPTLVTEKPMVTVTPGNKELKVEWTAVTGGNYYCVWWGPGDRIINVFKMATGNAKAEAPSEPAGNALTRSPCTMVQR